MEIMKSMLCGCMLVAVLICVSACRRTSVYGSDYSEIKAKGDTLPLDAMLQLDSLTLIKPPSSRYDSMRIRVLYLRLQDKADIMPSSEEDAKEVCAFFEIQGSPDERMEAYYYYASVCRDLSNIPTAIRNFHMAYDIGERGYSVDSTLWANTCSQLAALYSIQYDFNAAMDFSEKGCKIAEESGFCDVIRYVDVATNAYYASKTDKCVHYLMMALKSFSSHRTNCHRELDALSQVLLYASQLRQKPIADEAFGILNDYPDYIETPSCHFALALYELRYGSVDSAITHLKETCRKSADVTERYQAANFLLDILISSKKWEQVGQYVSILSQSADSILRQRKIPQTNRAAQEYLFKKRNAEINNTKALLEKFRRSWYISLIILVSLSIVVVVYFKRIKSLKRKVGMLSDANSTIIKLNEQLEKVTFCYNELSHSIKISKLHLDEGELLRRLKKSAEGLYSLQLTDWEALYAFTKEANPLLWEQLKSVDGGISVNDKRVLLLHWMGLSQVNISQIDGRSSSTIWRLIDFYRKKGISIGFSKKRNDKQ